MKITIIGLGKQGKKYFASMTRESTQAMADLGIVLDSVCDGDPRALSHIQQKYPKIPTYLTVDDLLARQKPDVAIVCLPTQLHFDVSKKLIDLGIHILKEKPYAIDLMQALQLDELLQKTQTKMMVATQRKFSDVYLLAKKHLSRLGKIYLVQGIYTFNLQELDNQWRSDGVNGGGALIDMGYHMIDVLLWYFGMPKTVTMRTTTQGRKDQKYDAEDTATVSFSYDSPPIIGGIFVSRTYTKKQEMWLIKGQEGHLSIKENSIYVYDTHGREIERLTAPDDNFDILRKQIEYFCSNLTGNSPSLINEHREHIQHIKLISAMYQSAQTQETVHLTQQALPNAAHFSWPIITSETTRAVLEQLSKTISIYNRSGIIEQFEDRFKKYHNRAYGLLSNSGTSAIFSMFEGLGLQKGDEVLVPSYTFFATVTPMLYLRATPVFCDCDENGNFEPSEIIKKATSRTRAVIVTHMWGVPCNMALITKYCEERHLQLLEDCSHAHGARYDGQLVGTFGVAAAWSLQGEKLVSGGEGGIMLTEDPEVYRRAVLQGHYNKRAMQEIPESHPMRSFALTGLGQKFRSHPLAVAIANQQFAHLDDWLKWRRFYAKRMIAAFSKIPFLKMPSISYVQQPSWYAFVMNFDSEAAQFTRRTFVDALHSAGLQEVSIPTGMQPVHNLPIFTNTEKALPGLYKQGIFSKTALQTLPSFPNSDYFFNTAIKLPVWSRQQDLEMVDQYIAGVLSVAHKMMVDSAQYSPTNERVQNIVRAKL